MQTVQIIGILFFLSELTLLVVKRSRSGKAPQQGNKDKHSLLILWVTICISMTLGMNFTRHWWLLLPSYLQTAGLIIAIGGIILRWISILQLGRLFTVDVAIRDAHQLKTDGLYKHVRHPSYTGLLLIVAGMGFATGSLLSTLVMVIPIFLALQYRIRTEEAALLSAFGDSYEAYSRRTSRLIPGIY